MDDNLAKLLEEEARKIQERSIINQESVERETEDIDCEIVGEEIYEVYNQNGYLIKVDLDTRDNEYILCNDSTFVHETKYVEIYDLFYNPFTNNLEKDFYGHYYIDNNRNTWIKFIEFNEDGSYDVEDWKPISKNNLYELTLDIIFIDSVEYYISREDRIKHGYTLQNGILVQQATIEDFKKELLIQYPYFEQVVKSIYKDNWDINTHTLFNRKCLIIKFDKFNITNSSRQSHEITDLYVLLPFNIANDDKITFYGALYGGRGSVSTVEKIANYNHSHLSGDWNVISQFCLGSGPIHNYILEFNRNPNENNLFSILYNIKIYVEWESIEGRPHRYMRNIGKVEILPNETPRNGYNLASIERDYFKKSTIPIKSYTKNNIPNILIDESILEIELLKYLNIDFHVFKDKTTGKYYKKGTVESIDTQTVNLLLNYKGEDIKTKVNKSVEIKVEDIEYVIHPQVTKAFINDAIRRIRKYYFKKTTGLDTGKSKNFYF